MMRASPLMQVLDLARWAPSGDNTQPWRFELVDERRFVILGSDTRDHCVYDLDGHPSQISLGALIETAAVAATAHEMALQVQRRPGLPDTTPTFDAELLDAPGQPVSPLLAAVPLRSVQRKPLQQTALTAPQITALEAAVGPGYRLRWFATPALRRTMAGLMFANAKIRLTTPEAFEVHRQIIHFGARFSEDRVPSQALGVDAMSVAMMRFGLQSWQRVAFLNRWLAGTVLPRVQMDWLPGVRCAAHLAIVADSAPHTIDDYVAAGRAVQRLWLTVTQLGLQHQPELTPLVFRRYVREGRRFTTLPGPARLAERLADRLDNLFGEDAARTVWIGRVGHGPAPAARSGRLPLTRLIVKPVPTA